MKTFFNQQKLKSFNDKFIIQQIGILKMFKNDFTDHKIDRKAWFQSFNAN